MSDNDKAVPPWLRPARVPSGGPFFYLSAEVADAIADGFDTVCGRPMPLSEWLAWRSRIRKLLAFVEPAKAVVDVPTEAGLYWARLADSEEEWTVVYFDRDGAWPYVNLLGSDMDTELDEIVAWGSRLDPPTGE